MAFYLMHLHEHGNLARDGEAFEAADMPAAQVRAIEGILELMSHDVRTGQIDLTGWIEIEGEDGACERVSFTEALNVKLS